MKNITGTADCTHVTTNEYFPGVTNNLGKPVGVDQETCALTNDLRARWQVRRIPHILVWHQGEIAKRRIFLH